jgi:hypothetical protein
MNIGNTPTVALPIRTTGNAPGRLHEAAGSRAMSESDERMVWIKTEPTSGCGPR